jgi:hypothetical protein
VKKRTLQLTLFTFLLALVTGCSTHNTALYNYADYSENYYAYKKNPSTESQLELQKAIELAIENAQDSQSGRVAPGLYANLGYIYLKEGKNKLALENFKKEKALYPESARFMDRMIKKVEMLEGDNDEK